MDKRLFYRRDCRHFKGFIPCKPHKLYGVHCEGCEHYEKAGSRILIIKLGAIGDVIRTTPLLRKLRETEPNAEIWWLSQSPEILPEQIDKILKYDLDSIILLQNTKFDKVYNLDKDLNACALASSVETKDLFGFTLKDGKPSPANELAEHKYLTGIFDDLNKENTKSYPREIFELCGYEYNGEEYLLEYQSEKDWNLQNGRNKIIGLNTGCGDRWVSRLWSEDNWAELAVELRKEGYYPVLLGGKQEHERNLRISEMSGVLYPGYFPLNDFISLVDQCDGVVTAVTMAMHLAIGLKKQLILFNNIFNPHEFELFGRGEIVQPQKECKCFFSPKCTNEEYFCMDHLTVGQILEAVKRHL